MTHKMLVVYFALGTSLAVLAQVPTLLQPTTLTGTVPDNDATVKRARNVLVNTPLLQSPTATSFAVPLFDGAQVMLVRDSTSIVAKGGLIWRGHAMNDPTTTAAFSDAQWRGDRKSPHTRWKLRTIYATSAWPAHNGFTP